MKTQYNIILFLAILFNGCKKETGEKLPEESHTGANTFGAMLENKNFVASGKCSSTMSLNLQTSCVAAEKDNYGNSFIRIYARDDYFTNTQAVKVYILLEMDSSFSTFVKLRSSSIIFNSQGIEDRYFLDSMANNEFRLKAATASIIAGTFTLYYRNNNGASKKIQHGRFDISF